jgi:hypothetical protein
MPGGYWTRRPVLRDDLPPTADEVAYCPPHFWLLEAGWQECRKCGARRRIGEPPPPDEVETPVAGTDTAQG